MLALVTSTPEHDSPKPPTLAMHGLARLEPFAGPLPPAAQLRPRMRTNRYLRDLADERQQSHTRAAHANLAATV